MMERELSEMQFWATVFISTKPRENMKGYSRNREDFIDLLIKKYAMTEEIYNGCLGLWEEATDFLLTWSEAEKLPELDQQDDKIYEYNQGSSLDCTLYSAFGAVSDLFNYEWKQKEIDEMVEESYNRGRIKGHWWYVKSAVDLVADYWNNHHSDLGKVVYYRISLRDTELVDKILTKNYTLCSWYRGNQKYNVDRNDGILNWTTFWTSTYGHAVSWIGRDSKRYIKDNYKGRKSWKLPTNIYEVEHTPAELVSGWTYYSDAYLFTKVNNIERIKKLNEMKAKILNGCDINSELWHLSWSETHKNKLHEMNNFYREWLEYINKELESLT